MSAHKEKSMYDFVYIQQMFDNFFLRLVVPACGNEHYMKIQQFKFFAWKSHCWSNN